MKILVVFAVVFALAFGCLGGQPGGSAPDADGSVPDTGGRGQDAGSGMMGGRDFEPVDRATEGLARASESVEYELENGSTFRLEAKPVAREIEGNVIQGYAYNGQLPGPILRVKQGSTVFVNFTNSLGSDTTVHWHGLRLENRHDGVPDVTQKAVAPGGSFLYKLDFPDEGAYWYHPHVREDLQQELGLYGFIIVEPNESGYYNDVDREEVLALDDILLSGDDVYPFDANATNFALMGRFGNVMLVNGRADYALEVVEGEKVRFYILDAANVRTFNLSIEGMRMKVVGGDGGKAEREYLADSVYVSPSERLIVEVEFDRPGTFAIMSKNPLRERTLGRVVVREKEGAGNDGTEGPESPKNNTDIISEMDAYEQYFDKPVDFDYILTVDVGGMGGGMMGGMMDHTEEGIEWEDTMYAMNSFSTSDRTTWIIRDRASGQENMDAAAAVPKGEIVKIRLENDEDSDHPMQHAIHIHGAQFLVLTVDGEKNGNLVWKDTVNIPTGSTVELLTYFPNEGEWMMHCHIAEHLSSGMMTSFEVS
ncbi:MAG: multicopper oxidase family protein [Candidatus Micrarchaeota archaeon]